MSLFWPSTSMFREWHSPHTVGRVWGLHVQRSVLNASCTSGANACAALHAYDSKTNGLKCLLGVLPFVTGTCTLNCQSGHTWGWSCREGRPFTLRWLWRRSKLQLIPQFITIVLLSRTPSYSWLSMRQFSFFPVLFSQLTFDLARWPTRTAADSP